MDMLKIVLYGVVLLGEVLVCLVGVKSRVQNKHKLLSTIMAIIAMLAFFVTVAYISTPYCHWSINQVVCPAN
jgi:hypothetical protein